MFFLHKQVIILNHQAKPITTIRFISQSYQNLDQFINNGYE